MQQLMIENTFFKVLFEALPVMALVADAGGTVYALNDATRTTLGLQGEANLKKIGELFTCINSKVDAQGCGHAPGCQQCMVRQTALGAISGNKISRTKGKLDIMRTNYQIVTLIFLISAAPIEYKGKQLAVIILEDVSNVTELQGLLPMCAACKKIRDDAGYWNQVEKYIQEHSEVEFTHGLCPECIERMYPQFAKKVNQPVNQPV